MSCENFLEWIVEMGGVPTVANMRLSADTKRNDCNFLIRGTKWALKLLETRKQKNGYKP